MWDTEAKYVIIIKFSLSLISTIFEKKVIFSGLVLLFLHFFIKIQIHMSQQENKRQRIYDLLYVKTKQKDFRNNWSFLMAPIKPRP